jgi:hypothetical protein
MKSKECKKVGPKLGQFVNAACSKEVVVKGEAAGEWETVAGGGAVVKTKFSDTSGVSTLKALTITITCQTSKSVGEIEGKARVKKVAVTFEKCTAKKGTEACEVKSPGAAKETIVTNPLKGELGEVEIPTGTSKVGEDLQAEVGTEFVKLEGTCIPNTAVTGNVIGEVKPVGGPPRLTGQLVFAEEAGHQKIQKYEPDSDEIPGEITSTLKAFGVEARFVSTDTITFEEAVEVTLGV